MDTTTIDAIKGLVARLGSQRKASAYLGESPGVVSDIVRGRGKHVSLATENRVRAALGLPAILPRVEVEVCPDCGGVHVGRCHGREVVLRPVRHRRLPSRIADMPTGMLAVMIRTRAEAPSS